MPFLLVATVVSQKLLVMLIALIPLAELRGSMPYAIFVLGMDWKAALPLSIVGNFIPVVPLLFFLETFSHRLRRCERINRIMTWYFERTKSKSGVVQRFEALGLAIFVGIPLPFTGAWSGCVAAFLCRIPMRLAIPSIALGILIAGVLVTLVCLGVIQASFFLGHWGAR